ncbi:MAG: putative TonB-dependent receptor [Rhizobacter sp.]|nr:putative TonB-dependent receptor [Rhizobacter sp.]
MTPREFVEALRRTGFVMVVVSAVAAPPASHAQGTGPTLIAPTAPTAPAVPLADAAGAVQAEPQTLQTVEVKGGRSTDLIGVADSATEGTITARQLATRPLLRAAEVLESVPGMTVTQHSGDGKANQYFLRGFNLDHGSDFATFVNGMPINNVTHAHGQGYTDLNFLIPELVGAVRYRKGAYNAEDGDFAVTGAAYIDYVHDLAQPFVDVTFGEHNYRRLLGAGSTKLNEDIVLLGAIELGGTDGPWENRENLHKVNGVLRLTSGTPSNGLTITGMSYDSRWTGTEEVPERAVLSGEIGRFGTLAPTDGGITHRRSLSADWIRSDDTTTTRASAYVVSYGLNLFSTPSGLQDAQHEQEDRRTILGVNASRAWQLGETWKDSELTLGLQLRQDRMPRVGLYETIDRQRTDTVRDDKLTETEAAAYASARTQWLPWLRSNLGLRIDRASATVQSLGGEFNTANGGKAQGSQVSPKVALAFGPFDALGGIEFYADWGRGFHSNDFRGATSTENPVDGSAIAKVEPLAKATTSEVGVRARPWPGWNTALSFWQTKLGSELVFVGDQGVTEPRGASRRHGIEWSNDYTPNGWLLMDADVAVSQARFVTASNGGTHVPNSIPLSASVGVSVERQGPWFGGLRLRYLGAYPLEETGTRKSSAFMTANLKLGYRVTQDVRLTLDVLNLFDRKANDIEYWGSSCTASEGAACNGGAGFDGKLVHPLEPRTFRVSARMSF